MFLENRDLCFYNTLKGNGRWVQECQNLTPCGIKSMEALIEIQRKDKGSILLLKIKGRLDHVTVPQVDHQLFNDIEQGNTLIAMDFSEVSYLSIAGLHFLLALHKKVEENNGRLAIFSVNHQATNILKVTNSDSVLKMYKTENEAVQYCKSSTSKK